MIEHHSHSSLALWNLCKRRWYEHYIMGKREPGGRAAAYSTHMVHGVIEDWVGGGEVDFDAHWTNYQSEVVENDDPDYPVLTLDTSKAILAKYQASPVEGRVSQVERFNELASPNGRLYVSKPDFLVERESGRFTVDIKFATSAWQSAKRPWPLKPLSPFDDQLLGQAVVAKADGFIRVTFQGDRKSGNVVGPIIEEKLVDAALAEEWQSETASTIAEVTSWLKRGPHVSWPKDTNSCNAFGRQCPWFNDCKNGFKRKEQ